ncbi:hypothetical protein [Streptomyces botrytidirepellens]|uniref:hypothetical protein n=1 Tax=Streptomyces botrytidirepellens TaxID=2486417 RepID=UPI0011CD58BD|nr:hypothetical protein [Streptomyces botrytidirepellens]
MDPMPAFLIASAATLLGAFAGSKAVAVIIRRSVVTMSAVRVPDGYAWRQQHERRSNAIVGCVQPAEEIAHIAAMWPVLNHIVRMERLRRAQELQDELTRRCSVVHLEANAALAAAADELVEQSARIVAGLDPDQPQGAPLNHETPHVRTFIAVGRAFPRRGSRRVHRDQRPPHASDHLNRVPSQRVAAEAGRNPASRRWLPHTGLAWAGEDRCLLLDHRPPPSAMA